MDRAVKVPQLVNENGAISSASQEEAALRVSSFAKDLGSGSLNRMLFMANNHGKESAENAARLAKAVTKNSRTLHDEVRRFLSLVGRP